MPTAPIIGQKVKINIFHCDGRIFNNAPDAWIVYIAFKARRGDQEAIDFLTEGKWQAWDLHKEDGTPLVDEQGMGLASDFQAVTEGTIKRRQYWPIPMEITTSPAIPTGEAFEVIDLVAEVPALENSDGSSDN